MKQQPENIKSIIHLDREEYLIRYRLSYACNYNCKDCYQDPDRAISSVIDTEKILSTVDKINLLVNALPTDKPITLYLEGGEISLFDISKLVLSRINLDRISTLKLVTNLSAPIEYYRDILNVLNTHNIKPRWQASFHLGQCNPEEFFKKVRTLPISIVLVVIDNQNYKDYRPYLQYMLDEELNFTVSPKTYSEVISEEVIKEIEYWEKRINNKFYKITYFNDETEYLSSYQVKKFFDTIKYESTCTHRKNIAIDPYGSIHFLCNRNNPLGNILDMSERDIERVSNKMRKACICLTKHHCSLNCGGIDIYREND